MLRTYRIEKIATREPGTGKKNGLMIPLWKDYDPGRKLKPRYIYYMTCLSGRSKGPYLHTKRRGLLTLVDGRATLVYQIDGEFQELKLRAGRNAVMVDIPAGVGYRINNPYRSPAHFVVICDYPWKKGDSETITPNFHAYFKKKRR